MKFDESKWPIVHVVMGEAFDRETVEQAIASWESVLARREKFALLLVQTGEKSEKPDKESTQRYMAWCKANKERISEMCAGMAMVFPSAKLLLMYKPVAALSVRKFYGCAGKAFSGETEAEEWLQRRLEDGGE